MHNDRFGKILSDTRILEDKKMKQLYTMSVVKQEGVLVHRVNRLRLYQLYFSCWHELF